MFDLDEDAELNDILNNGQRNPRQNFNVSDLKVRPMETIFKEKENFNTDNNFLIRLIEESRENYDEEPIDLIKRISNQIKMEKELEEEANKIKSMTKEQLEQYTLELIKRNKNENKK